MGGERARGVGRNVVLRPRDDLFVQSRDQLVTDDGRVLDGIQVFAANSVTSIPDNIGCCEVISVGAEVQTVQPGDIAFIDFFDVDQGFQIANSDHFVAKDHVFRARFDPSTGEVEPLAGYALTKRVPGRMKVALTGTDRVEVPPYILTDGIPSGFDSDGVPVLFTIYEEVVAVGPPAVESKTRPLHRLERAVLDLLAAYECGRGEWIAGEALRDNEADAINAYLRWRRAPRALDLSPGDLVPFCTQFGTKLRVRGQFLTLVAQDALLCVIDDRAILDEAIRAGKAGQIVRPRVVA
jgi:hypothetical protein